MGNGLPHPIAGNTAMGQSSARHWGGQTGLSVVRGNLSGGLRGVALGHERPFAHNRLLSGQGLPSFDRRLRIIFLTEICECLYKCRQGDIVTNFLNARLRARREVRAQLFAALISFDAGGYSLQLA